MRIEISIVIEEVFPEDVNGPLLLGRSSARKRPPELHMRGVVKDTSGAPKHPVAFGSITPPDVFCSTPPESMPEFLRLIAARYLADAIRKAIGGSGS